MSGWYRFDDNAIVYEILDNEVVLVNLEQGYYYILDDIASLIWMELKNGSTEDNVVQSLLTTYSAPPETIQLGVKALIAELVKESILQPESTAVPALPTKPDELAPSKNRRREFHSPTLFKYTDMEYLIQIDPIWDYDETGWPKRRTNTPANKK